MTDEQNTLKRAKALIIAKKYDEARRLLTTIQQDSTAQQWLAKLDQIAPQSSNSGDDSLLQHAKQLIANNQVDSAREILEQYPDNPTARQWLSKLDQMTPQEPMFASDSLFPKSDLDRVSEAIVSQTDTPTINPWNPWILRVFPIGVVGYPLNWRRLGKPEWAMETFLVGFLILGAFISSMVISTTVLDEFASPLGIGLLVTTGVANLVYWTTIHLAQTGAYRKWNSTLDPIAVINHPYNLLRNFAIWGSIGAVAAVVITVALIFSFRDSTFDHERFSLTYPSGWEDVTATSGYCEDIYFQCPLHIRTSQYGYNSVAILFDTGYSDFTLEEWDQFFWEDAQAYLTDGVREIRVDPIIVDGFDGIKREYLELDPDEDALYVMEIHVLVDDTMFAIEVWGENEAIFEEKRDTSMEIINSIDFK